MDEKGKYEMIEAAKRTLGKTKTKRIEKTTNTIQQISGTTVSQLMETNDSDITAINSVTQYDRKEIKSEELLQLEETLIGKDSTIEILIEENEILRAKLTTFDSQFNETDEIVSDRDIISQVADYNNKLKEYEEVIKERDKGIKMLTEDVERVTRSRDDLQNEYTTQIDQLTTHVHTLQQQLQQAGQWLDNPLGEASTRALVDAKNEILCLQKEFSHKEQQVRLLQKAIKERDNAMQLLVTQINELNGDYKATFEQLNDLKRELNDRDDRLKSCENDFVAPKLNDDYGKQLTSESEKVLLKCKDSISSLAKDFDDNMASSSSTSLTSSDSSFKITNNDLERQLDRLRGELDQFYGEEIAKIKDCLMEEMKNERRRFEDEIHHLERERARFEGQTSKWQNQYMLLSQQNISSSDLVQQIGSAVTENVRLNQLIDELKAQIHMMSTSSSSSMPSSLKLQTSLNNQGSDKTNVISNKSIEVFEKGLKELERVRSENFNIEELFNEKDRLIKELKEEIDSTKEQYASEKELVLKEMRENHDEEVRRVLSKKEAEMKGLMEEKDRLLKQVSSWQHQYIQLSHQNLSSTDLVKQISSVVTENIRLNQLVDEFNSKFIFQYSQSNQSTKNVNKKQESGEGGSDETIESLKREIANLKRVNIENEHFEKELFSVEKFNEEVETKCESIKSEMNESAKLELKNSLEERELKFSIEISSLRNELVSLTSEKERLLKEVKSWQEQYFKLSQKNLSESDLMTNMNSVMIENIQLKSYSESLKESMLKIEEDKLNRLQRCVESGMNTDGDDSSKDNQAVEDLCLEIDSLRRSLNNVSADKDMFLKEAQLWQNQYVLLSKQHVTPEPDLSESITLNKIIEDLNSQLAVMNKEYEENKMKLKEAEETVVSLQKDNTSFNAKFNAEIQNNSISFERIRILEEDLLRVNKELAEKSKLFAFEKEMNEVQQKEIQQQKLQQQESHHKEIEKQLKENAKHDYMNEKIIWLKKVEDLEQKHKSEIHAFQEHSEQEIINLKKSNDLIGNNLLEEIEYINKDKNNYHLIHQQENEKHVNEMNSLKLEIINIKQFNEKLVNTSNSENEMRVVAFKKKSQEDIEKLVLSHNGKVAEFMAELDGKVSSLESMNECQKRMEVEHVNVVTNLNQQIESLKLEAERGSNNSKTLGSNFTVELEQYKSMHESSINIIRQDHNIIITTLYQDLNTLRTENNNLRAYGSLYEKVNVELEEMKSSLSRIKEDLLRVTKERDSAIESLQNVYSEKVELKQSLDKSDSEKESLNKKIQKLNEKIKFLSMARMLSKKSNVGEGVISTEGGQSIETASLVKSDDVVAEIGLDVGSNKADVMHQRDDKVLLKRKPVVTEQEYKSLLEERRKLEVELESYQEPSINVVSKKMLKKVKHDKTRKETEDIVKLKKEKLELICKLQEMTQSHTQHTVETSIIRMRPQEATNIDASSNTPLKTLKEMSCNTHSLSEVQSGTNNTVPIDKHTSTVDLTLNATKSTETIIHSSLSSTSTSMNSNYLTSNCSTSTTDLNSLSLINASTSTLDMNHTLTDHSANTGAKRKIVNDFPIPNPIRTTEVVSLSDEININEASMMEDAAINLQDRELEDFTLNSFTEAKESLNNSREENNFIEMSNGSYKLNVMSDKFFDEEQSPAKLLSESRFVEIKKLRLSLTEVTEKLHEVLKEKETQTIEYDERISKIEFDFNTENTVLMKNIEILKEESSTLVEKLQESNRMIEKFSLEKEKLVESNEIEVDKIKNDFEENINEFLIKHEELESQLKRKLLKTQKQLMESEENIVLIQKEKSTIEQDFVVELQSVSSEHDHRLKMLKENMESEINDLKNDLAKSHESYVKMYDDFEALQADYSRVLKQFNDLREDDHGMYVDGVETSPRISVEETLKMRVTSLQESCQISAAEMKTLKEMNGKLKHELNELKDKLSGIQGGGEEDQLDYNQEDFVTRFLDTSADDITKNKSTVELLKKSFQDLRNEKMEFARMVERLTKEKDQLLVNMLSKNQCLELDMSSIDLESSEDLEINMESIKLLENEKEVLANMLAKVSIENKKLANIIDSQESIKIYRENTEFVPVDNELCVQSVSSNDSIEKKDYVKEDRIDELKKCLREDVEGLTDFDPDDISSLEIENKNLILSNESLNLLLSERQKDIELLTKEFDIFKLELNSMLADFLNIIDFEILKKILNNYATMPSFFKMDASLIDTPRLFTSSDRLECFKKSPKSKIFIVSESEMNKLKEDKACVTTNKETADKSTEVDIQKEEMKMKIDDGKEIEVENMNSKVERNELQENVTEVKIENLKHVQSASNQEFSQKEKLLNIKKAKLLKSKKLQERMMAKDDKDNKLVELVESNKCLQTLNESLDKEIFELKQQFESSRKASDILQKEKEEIKREKYEFTNENNKLLTNIQEISKAQISLEECIQNYKSEIISKNEELSSLKKELESSLSSQMKIDSNIIKENIENNRMKEDLKLREAENQIKISDLEKEINELTSQKVELINKANDFSNNLEEVNGINNEKEIKLTNLMGQVEYFENQIKDLNLEWSKEKNQSEISKKETLHLVAQMSALNTQAALNENKIQELTQNTIEFELEKGTLKTKLDESNQEVSRLMGVNEENIKLNLEIESLKEKILVFENGVWETNLMQKANGNLTSKMAELEALYTVNLEDKSLISKKLIKSENDLVQSEIRIKENEKRLEEKDKDIKIAKESFERKHSELERYMVEMKIIEDELKEWKKLNEENKETIHIMVTDSKSNYQNLGAKLNEIVSVFMKVEEGKAELLSRNEVIINESNESRKSLEDNEVKYNSIIHNLELNLSDMRAKNTDLTNELINLNSQITIKANDSVEHHKVVEHLQRNHAEKDDSIKVLEDKFRIMEDTLRLEKVAMKDKNSSIVTENENKSKMINELNNKINTKNTELEQLSTLYNEEQVKLKNLMTLHEEINKELNQTKNTSINTTKTLEELSEKVKIYESQLNEKNKILDDLINDLDSSKNVSKENERIITSLNSELTHLKSDKEEALTSFNEKVTIINKSEEMISNLNIKLDTISTEDSNKIKFIDLLKNKIKQQTEKSTQEKKDLDEEMKSIKKEVVAYNADVEEAKSSKKVIEDQSTIISEIKFENETKSKLIEEHKRINKEQLKEMDKLQVMIYELHEAVKMYQLQPISSMENLHEEIIFLKSHNVNISDTNKTKDLIIKDLDNNLKDARTNYHELESFNHNNSITILEENQNLKKQNDNMKQKYQDFEKQQLEFENEKIKNEQFHTREASLCYQYIDALEEKNALVGDLKSQVELLNTDLTRIKVLYERAIQEKTKVELEGSEELMKAMSILKESEIKNNEMQQYKGNNHFEDIEELDEEIHYLKKCFKETNKEHQRNILLHTERYEHMQRSNQELVNEISSIKEREVIINKEIGERDSIIKQITNDYGESLKTIDEKNIIIEECNNKTKSIVTQEKQELRDQINILEDELLKKNENISKKESELSQMKSYVTETANSNSDQFETLNVQNEVKTDQLLNAEKIIQQLNNEVEHSMIVNNQKIEEADKLTYIIEDLNMKLKLSSDELFKKSKELEDLKLHVNSNKNDINLKTENTIIELNTRIETLLSQLNSSKLMNESLNKENELIKHKFSLTLEELNHPKQPMPSSKQLLNTDNINVNSQKEIDYEKDIVNTNAAECRIDEIFFENDNVTENRVELKLENNKKCFVYNSSPSEINSEIKPDIKTKSNKALKLEQAKLLKNKKLHDKEIEHLKVKLNDMEKKCLEKDAEVSDLKSQVDVDKQLKRNVDELLKEKESLQKLVHHYKNNKSTNPSNINQFHDLIDEKLIENNHFGCDYNRCEYNPATPPTSPSLTSTSSRAVSEVPSTKADDHVDMVDNEVIPKVEDKSFLITQETIETSLQKKNDDNIEVRSVGEQVDLNEDKPDDISEDQLMIIQEQFHDVVRLNTQLKEENALVQEDLEILSQSFNKTKSMCYELDQKLEEMEEQLERQIEDGKGKDSEIEELKSRVYFEQASLLEKEGRTNQAGEMKVLNSQNKMLNDAVKQYSSKITELQEVVDVQNLCSDHSKAMQKLVVENTHLHEENLKLMDENDQIKNKIEQLLFELNRANNTLGLHLEKSQNFNDTKCINTESEKVTQETSTLLTTSVNAPNAIPSEQLSLPLNNTSMQNSTFEAGTQNTLYGFVFSPELNSPSSFSGSDNFLLSDDGHLSSSEHEDIQGKLHLLLMENESLKKALKEFGDLHTSNDIKKSFQQFSSDSNLNKLGVTSSPIGQMPDGEKTKGESNVNPPTLSSQAIRDTSEDAKLKLSLAHVQDFSMSGSETNVRSSVRSSSSSSNSFNADRFLVRTPRSITSTSNDYQLELSESIGKTIDDYINLQGDYKRFKAKARNEYSRIKTRLVDALKQYNLLKIKYQELHDSIVFNNFVDQNLMVTENNSLRTRVLELEIIVERRDRMLKYLKNENENGQRSIKFDQPVIFEEKEEEMEENNKMMIEKLRDLELQFSILQSECNVLSDRNQKLNNELNFKYQKEKSQCAIENIDNRVLVREEPIIKMECFTLEEHSITENKTPVSTETTPTFSYPPFQNAKPILMIGKSVQVDIENTQANVKTFSDVSTETEADQLEQNISLCTLTDENCNANDENLKKITKKSSVSSLSNNHRKSSIPSLSSTSSSSASRRPPCSSSSKLISSSSKLISSSSKIRSSSSSSLIPSKSSKSNLSESKRGLQVTKKLSSMSTTAINTTDNKPAKSHVSKMFCKYCKEKALECARLQRLIWGAEEKLCKYQKQLDDMVVENENLNVQASGSATSQLATVLTTSTSKSVLSSTQKVKTKLSTTITTTPVPSPAGKFVRRCLKLEMENLEREKQSNKVKVSVPNTTKSSLTDATRNLVENVEAIVKKNEKLMKYNKERMKKLMKDYASAGEEIKSMKVSTLAKMQPLYSLSPHQSTSSTPLSSVLSSPVSDQIKFKFDSVNLQTIGFESSTIETIESLRKSYERGKTDYERLNKLYLETFREKQALLASIDHYKEREVARLEMMDKFVEGFKSSQNKIKMFDQERDIIKQRLETMGLTYNSLITTTVSTIDTSSTSSSPTLPSSSYSPPQSSLSSPNSSFLPPSSLSNQTTTASTTSLIHHSSVDFLPDSIPCPMALDMMQYYVDTLQHQFITSQPIDLVYSLVCQVDGLKAILEKCQCGSGKEKD